MTLRRLPLLAVLLALALPASAEARAPRHHPARAHSAVKCANADLVPAAGNLAAVRAAIVCLHNQVRAAHGLRRLDGNRRLQRAARGHSADMVAARYFEHTSLSGATMVDRILRVGYMRRNQRWTVGENLEWGTGDLATPRRAMDAWMNSPGHRANILRGGYAEMGVGVSLGTPAPDGQAGATYTVDFGVIR